MADLQSTEWTSRWASPRDGIDTNERIYEYFEFAGTPADNDTIALCKIPANYIVTDIVINITTTFDSGSSTTDADLGTYAFNRETGAIGAVGVIDCYANGTILIDGTEIMRFPTVATVAWRKAQTTDEVLVLTVLNIGTGAAGVLYGWCKMISVLT